METQYTIIPRRNYFLIDDRLTYEDKVLYMELNVLEYEETDICLPGSNKMLRKVHTWPDMGVSEIKHLAKYQYLKIPHRLKKNQSNEVLISPIL
jgi:hypothetical protein